MLDIVGNENREEITLNSAYNQKKCGDFASLLVAFCYRWLFIKGNVIIGEWGIFGV